MDIREIKRIRWEIFVSVGRAWWGIFGQAFTPHQLRPRVHYVHPAFVSSPTGER
jgi:hypothetical protein